MEIAIDLLMDGGDDGREAVPRVLACDTAGEVDVALAVDVPEAGSLGAGDDDLGGGDPARDEPVALGEHFLRRRLLAGGHDGSADCSAVVGSREIS